MKHRPVHKARELGDVTSARDRNLERLTTTEEEKTMAMIKYGVYVPQSGFVAAGHRPGVERGLACRFPTLEETKAWWGKRPEGMRFWTNDALFVVVEG